MKNIIAIALICLAYSLAAQQDTSYIVNIGGTYYEVTEAAKPIGDSATISNLYLSRAVDAARQFSQAANTVWGKPSFVSRILDANSALQNAVGTTVTALSIGLYGDAAVGSWSVTLNGGDPLSGTMAIAPNGGSLRLTVGGNTYTILLVGDSWMRLQNYPAGSFTDLFRVSGEIEFRSIEQDVIISKQ